MLHSKEIPAVSVIIPTLNEERYIPLLLESLAKIRNTIDIIVVDGNSEDKTVNIVESFIPKFSEPSSLQLIKAQIRGTSFQRNLGVDSAKYETLLFLDADTFIPSPSIYEKLVHAFVESGRAVGAPRLFVPEAKFLGWLMCEMYNLLVRISLLLGRPYFAGVCIITTKTVFDEIGGFDEAMPIAEDVDFASRAALAGKALLLPVKIPVSPRRTDTYGYWRYLWIYSHMAVERILTGKLRYEKIFYPFGEYDKHKR